MKIKDFAESKMNIAFLLLGAFSPVLREDHITIRWQKENEVTQIRTEFAMCNKMQWSLRPNPNKDSKRKLENTNSNAHNQDE